MKGEYRISRYEIKEYKTEGIYSFVNIWGTDIDNGNTGYDGRVDNLIYTANIYVSEIELYKDNKLRETLDHNLKSIEYQLNLARDTWENNVNEDNQIKLLVYSNKSSYVDMTYHYANIGTLICLMFSIINLVDKVLRGK